MMNENVPQKIDPESQIESPDVTEDVLELAEVGQEVETLSAETELDLVKAALAESEKRALVAIADLENYRKRANKNAQDQIKYASLPMMAELLEVVDNLNRAIEAASEDENSGSLLEGVKMVSDQILAVLKANNCQQIESVGQPFDPNLHQAVQMQPSNEYAANTVMMEMRAGYMLHDRVIRPAQVFVSTGSADSEPNHEN